MSSVGIDEKRKAILMINHFVCVFERLNIIGTREGHDTYHNLKRYYELRI